jgi:hypothetical protein
MTVKSRDRARGAQQLIHVGQSDATGRVVDTFHVIFAVKTPLGDSQYGPCDQSDTRECQT